MIYELEHVYGIFPWRIALIHIGVRSVSKRDWPPAPPGRLVVETLLAHVPPGYSVGRAPLIRRG